MISRKICVGKITKPIGLNGHVGMIFYTQSSDFFKKHKILNLIDSREIKLTGFVKLDGNKVKVKIDGINSRNDAEILRNQEVFVLRHELEQILEDEYYIEDLVNVKVFNCNNEYIGEVTAIFDHGAGSFLDIKTSTGKIGTIPFNETFIDIVNIEDRTLTLKVKDVII